jgi:hypothetical protein
MATGGVPRQEDGYRYGSWVAVQRQHLSLVGPVTNVENFSDGETIEFSAPEEICLLYSRFHPSLQKLTARNKQSLRRFRETMRRARRSPITTLSIKTHGNAAGAVGWVRLQGSGSYPV